MPIKHYLILCSLFGSCLLVIGIAWASGAELAFGQHIIPGPNLTTTLLIFGSVTFSAIFSLRQKMVGPLLSGGIAILMAISALKGHLIGHWTPGGFQYLTIILLATTAIYGCTICPDYLGSRNGEDRSSS